jgi:hypothetical protein
MIAKFVGGPADGKTRVMNDDGKPPAKARFVVQGEQLSERTYRLVPYGFARMESDDVALYTPEHPELLP